MNLKVLKEYLKASFLELKKVKWLTQKETIDLTLEVIFFSLTFFVIYGIIDSILVGIILKLR